MIELIFLLQADHDVQAAFERYEEYQSGRGEVFMQQLDAALTLLRQYPEIAPVYGARYRRMLIRDFPYGISYEVQPARVIVGAIMDLRQDRKQSGESCSDADCFRSQPSVHPLRYSRFTYCAASRLFFARRFGPSQSIFLPTPTCIATQPSRMTSVR